MYFVKFMSDGCAQQLSDICSDRVECTGKSGGGFDTQLSGLHGVFGVHMWGSAQFVIIPMTINLEMNMNMFHSVRGDRMQGRDESAHLQGREQRVRHPMWNWAVPARTLLLRV